MVHLLETKKGQTQNNNNFFIIKAYLENQLVQTSIFRSVFQGRLEFRVKANLQSKPLILFHLHT